MTFVEALGGHNGQTIIEALGGYKGDRLEDVMDRREISVSDNPMAALAMDFDIAADTDLLGKVVDNLQSDMAVDSWGKVTGTSKYVTGYTGFSGKASERKGNFVAFHISVGDLIIGTGVTVKVNGVSMDPDGLHILRFTEGQSHPKAVITASAEGHKSFTKVFDFTDVVKQSA